MAGKPRQPPANPERTTKAERLRRERLVEGLLVEGLGRHDLHDRLAQDHELDLPMRTLDTYTKRVRDRWGTEAAEAAAYRRETMARLIRREASTMLQSLHAEDGAPPTWSNWTRALELLAKVEGLLVSPCPAAELVASDDDAVDLSALTDEELEQLVEISRKIGATE